MINPTGYTALDLVGFTDKGTYASNVNYVKNDIVHYGGNLWRCLIDDTMNVTPAEGNNWTVFVGEPTNLVERIIAPLEENPATVAYATGRQIIYDDWLWEVIDDIAVGDVLIDYDVDPTNANIKKAAPVETQLLDIKAKVGPLASLATTIKTSIVAAINEIVGKIGNLSLLDTTDKTSAVNAINEVNTKVSKTEDLISIVENGNTCTHTGGISKGQYVNWKGDLYTADSDISVGTTFASSGGSKNLTAVVDGGLNELNSKIDDVIGEVNTRVRLIKTTIDAGASKTIALSSSPYLAGTVATNTSTLCLVAGIGYGADDIRNKITTLISSDYISITPSNSSMGIRCTNNSSVTVNFFILQGE